MSELSALEAQLTLDDFQKFADFFYQKTGIVFEPRRQYFVKKRLAQRMLETGSANFREYFTAMRQEATQGEFQQLVNAMTVNETYFFREDYQLDVLVGEVLNEVVANQAQPDLLRIWSIPCSTGEEPYSIALRLLEDWPPIRRLDVKLVASDIDTTVLAAAERAVYTDRSVIHVPPALRAKYFHRTIEGGWALSREVVDCVQRLRLNVTDPRSADLIPPMDVIFCRNLLIYFDDASRRTAVSVLYDVLKPQGFLFLGHSESMSRISSRFRVRRFGKCVVYQKP